MAHQPHSAPLPLPHTPRAPDIVAAVSVQLDENANVDQRRMVDALFSGAQWEGKDQVHYGGDSFVVIRGADLAKSRLLSMFGGTRSLAEVDASINSLIRHNCGWLAGQSDDVVEILSGEFSANLAQICSLVMSSLSPDITSKVKSLVESVHTILSGDSFFASTKQIDVNVYQKNGSEILCIHTRYQAVTKKRGIKVIFLGGSKRGIKVIFNLRKIGISSAFWDSLAAVDESCPPFIVVDGLVSRSPRDPSLGDSSRLRPTQSEPSSSQHLPRSWVPSLHTRLPLTPMAPLTLPTTPTPL
jgi:hypothetical protein